MIRTKLKTPILQFSENDFLNAKESIRESDNSLLNSALHYASFGCPVFPVHSIIVKDGVTRCSCLRWRDCNAQGKHPRTRYGLKDASSDEKEIREWWRKYPTANVGLLTGKRAGFFVLDLDIKYGGNYSLLDLQEYYEEELGENYEPLPATLTAITGSGGRHYFFKYPEDVLIYGSVSEIGDGLDIRGEQNYVVASPSNHLSGNDYAWFGVDTPILDTPDWLIHEILFKESEKDSLESASPVSENNGKIKEGGRHNKFWRYICGLINSHSQEEVLRMALERNKEWFQPPFNERTVTYQVNYLFNKYGKSKNPNMGLKQ